MKMYSESRGSGTPVLLIHGIACDRSFFQETAQILAEDYQVISYDRRGYGKHTEEELEDYSLEVQTLDALKVLQSYTEKQAYIVAHSMGCVIALQLAINNPELIKGMLLIDPIFGYDHENAKIYSKWKTDLEFFLQEKKAQKAYLYFQREFGLEKNKADISIKPCDMKKIKADMDNLQNFMRGELKVILQKIPDIEDVLALETPVIVGVTEMTPRNVLSSIAMREALTLGWRTAAFPGTHNSLKEQPDVSAKKIKEILKPGNL